jgi:hypothetical protein
MEKKLGGKFPKLCMQRFVKLRKLPFFGALFCAIKFCASPEMFGRQVSRPKCLVALRSLLFHAIPPDVHKVYIFQ